MGSRIAICFNGWLILNNNYACLKFVYGTCTENDITLLAKSPSHAPTVHEKYVWKCRLHLHWHNSFRGFKWGLTFYEKLV